jgi:hypothetical protein
VLTSYRPAPPNDSSLLKKQQRLLAAMKSSDASSIVNETNKLKESIKTSREKLTKLESDYEDYQLVTEEKKKTLTDLLVFLRQKNELLYRETGILLNQFFPTEQPKEGGDEGREQEDNGFDRSVDFGLLYDRIKAEREEQHLQQQKEQQLKKKKSVTAHNEGGKKGRKSSSSSSSATAAVTTPPVSPAAHPDLPVITLDINDQTKEQFPKEYKMIVRALEGSQSQQQPQENGVVLPVTREEFAAAMESMRTGMIRDIESMGEVDLFFQEFPQNTGRPSSAASNEVSDNKDSNPNPNPSSAPVPVVPAVNPVSAPTSSSSSVPASAATGSLSFLESAVLSNPELVEMIKTNQEQGNNRTRTESSKEFNQFLDKDKKETDSSSTASQSVLLLLEELVVMKDPAARQKILNNHLRHIFSLMDNSDNNNNSNNNPANSEENQTDLNSSLLAGRKKRMRTNESTAANMNNSSSGLDGSIIQLRTGARDRMDFDRLLWLSPLSLMESHLMGNLTNPSQTIFTPSDQSSTVSREDYRNELGLGFGSYPDIESEFPSFVATHPVAEEVFQAEEERMSSDWMKSEIAHSRFKRSRLELAIEEMEKLVVEGQYALQKAQFTCKQIFNDDNNERLRMKASLLQFGLIPASSALEKQLETLSQQQMATDNNNAMMLLELSHVGAAVGGGGIGIGGGAHQFLPLSQESIQQQNNNNAMNAGSSKSNKSKGGRNNARNNNNNRNSFGGGLLLSSMGLPIGLGGGGGGGLPTDTGSVAGSEVNDSTSVRGDNDQLSVAGTEPDVAPPQNNNNPSPTHNSNNQKKFGSNNVKTSVGNSLPSNKRGRGAGIVPVDLSQASETASVEKNNGNNNNNNNSTGSTSAPPLKRKRS